MLRRASISCRSSSPAATAAAIWLPPLLRLGPGATLTQPLSLADAVGDREAPLLTLLPLPLCERLTMSSCAAADVASTSTILSSANCHHRRYKRKRSDQKSPPKYRGDCLHVCSRSLTVSPSSSRISMGALSCVRRTAVPAIIPRSLPPQVTDDACPIHSSPLPLISITGAKINQFQYIIHHLWSKIHDFEP